MLSAPGAVASSYKAKTESIDPACAARCGARREKRQHPPRIHSPFDLLRTRWLNGRIRRRTIVLRERRIAKGSTFGNSRLDLRSYVFSRSRCRLHQDRTPGTRSRSGSDRQILHQLLVPDQGLHDVVLRAAPCVRPGRGMQLEAGNGKLAFEPCIAASSAAASSSPKMTLVKINARLAGPILFRLSRCETR